MLNVLTDRTWTSPPEPGMINLTPYQDNDKSNISFNADDSNCDTLLSEMD